MRLLANAGAPRPTGRRIGSRAATMTAMTEMRRERWERAADLPLTIAALVFVAAYAWPILNPDLPRGWATACRVSAWATWAAFALDYAARLALSVDRRRFIRSSPLDLAVVALPLLRPLRLLRLLTLLNVLNRNAGRSLHGRVGVYVAGATTLVLLVSSLAMLDAERDAHGANITSYGDALWWAATTVTTVGYGDRYPVTGIGRMIAVALMVCGIALIGVVTAAVATWLVQRVAEVEAAAQVATRRDIEALSAQVADLRVQLQGALGSRGQPPARPRRPAARRAGARAVAGRSSGSGRA